MSNAEIRFALSGRQHGSLRAHLFPADGMEAVALVLCGFAGGRRRRQIVAQRIVLIPHDELEHRSATEVRWSVERFLLPLADEIERHGLSVMVVHSHPDGLVRFSTIDDRCDRELFPAVHLWSACRVLHGAAVMTRDGRLTGRVVDDVGSFFAIDLIAVAGDEIHLFRDDATKRQLPEHALRTAQTFGQGTYELLHGLRIGVVGCSGTGSIVIELLARCGVGHLVLVDPERLEVKNLNRVLNSTRADAVAGKFKVDMLADAIAAFGTDSEVEAHAADVFDPAVREVLSECDVLFGCVDTLEGRHILNRLASAFSLPYFDVGIAIEADGHGGIEQAVADAHYVQPGGSSLMSRSVYTGEMLGAESTKRLSPAQYEEGRTAGYLAAVAEDRPAVMPLNMIAANTSVLDFLARVHQFRLDANGEFARQRHDVVHGHHERGGDGDPCPLMLRDVGTARCDNLGC